MRVAAQGRESGSCAGASGVDRTLSVTATVRYDRPAPEPQTAARLQQGDPGDLELTTEHKKYV